jgi:hypothetical protein
VSDLYHHPSHEPLAGGEWGEAAAREAIAEIVEDAERSFDPDGLWASHPLDEDGDQLPPQTALYMGASGVIWALDALERTGAASLTRRWGDVAAGLPERYSGSPDLPEWTGGDAVPSIFVGETGILLVAHRLSPAQWHVERIVECIHANTTNPTRELLWGSPSTMLAAELMLERTGDERLVAAWRESADWLWDEWRDEVWLQDMYGKSQHYMGAGHGFASNVRVLAGGALLDGDRLAALERRALKVIRGHIQRDGEMAQWPALLEPAGPEVTTRTQWCHGAPGLVTSFAKVAPEDAELTAALVACGELTWHAGPLVKGPGLCHGTAGNGYAFLKLLDRTGDERWLERARAFAMHAAGQVRAARSQHGRGRHSLFTGDAGVAAYLASCIAGDAAMPVLDVM